jgi:hypothetical protein
VYHAHTPNFPKFLANPAWASSASADLQAGIQVAMHAATQVAMAKMAEEIAAMKGKCKQECKECKHE